MEFRNLLYTSVKSQQKVGLSRAITSHQHNTPPLRKWYKGRRLLFNYVYEL